MPPTDSGHGSNISALPLYDVAVFSLALVLAFVLGTHKRKDPEACKQKQQERKSQEQCEQRCCQEAKEGPAGQKAGPAAAKEAEGPVAIL